MVVPRGRAEGAQGAVCCGDRVSVLQEEKGSLGGQWWWLHNSVNVLNTTELYAKHSEDGGCYAMYI